MVSRIIVFISLLLIFILVTLLIYLLVRKELNKRLIKQEEKIRKPESLFENLKYESNKNSSILKTVLIWILFFLCIISYFVGRKIERNLLTEVMIVAIDKHNKNNYSNKLMIKNIVIEKKNLIFVKIFLEDSSKKYIEEQAFNYTGIWQGSDIIECEK